jgi:hypothetical protein
VRARRRSAPSRRGASSARGGDSLFSRSKTARSSCGPSTRAARSGRRRG